MEIKKYNRWNLRFVTVLAVVAGLFLFPVLGYSRAPELKLDPKGLNPVTLNGTTPEIVRSASKLVGLGTNCIGHISQEPVAVVEIPKGSSGDILITANNLYLLLVVSESGQFWCSNSGRVRPGNWPGGKARIFVGPRPRTGSSPKHYKFSLAVQDLSRPLNLGWKDVPNTVLDGVPDKHVILSDVIKSYRDDYGFKLHNCGGRTASMPSRMIEIRRPITDLSIMVTGSDKKTSAALVGPFSKDMRKFGSRCFRGKAKITAGRELKPGRYALIGAHKDGKKHASFSVIIAGAKEKHDPMFFAPVPKNLTLEQRVLTSFLPFWSKQEDMKINRFRHSVSAAQLVQELFLKAPKELFVFAKYDLDGGLLQLEGGLRKGVTPEFPKKGEPLLIYADNPRRIFAADGSTFTVRTREQVFDPRPTGGVTLPDEARNTEYNFSLEHTPSDSQSMLNQAVPPNRRDPAYKPFISYIRVIKAHDACVKRVWRPVAGRVAGLRNARRRTAADEQQLIRLEETYGRRERKVCKPARLNKARQAYYNAMVKVKKAPRDKALKDVSKRLEKLFGSK